MIVKKPYAFLIKNFRLIHGLLLIVLIYLSVRTTNIYSFFNSYGSSGIFQYQTVLASDYVDFIMFGGCVIAIIISLLVYYLLSLKQKNNNIYLWMFIFYICLFVFFIYIHSLIRGIEVAKIKSDSLGIINEICLIALIPQFVFSFIVLGRTLGFNLKQFEFRKDLEDIEVDSSDNEEVELTLGTDTYKIKRAFRKFLRLSKYFFLENKMFVIGGVSIFILVTLLGVYAKFNVYSVSYNEKQLITASTVSYKVNESYIVDTNFENSIVKRGKKFILVNVTITNNVKKEYELSRKTFTLELPSRTIEPSYNYKNEFKDLGTIFTPGIIKLGTSNDYIVVFEIDESEENEDYILRLKNFDDSTFGKIETKYKNIIIKPIDLTQDVDKGVFEYGSTLNFSDTILKNYKLKLSNIEIADKFKEKYVKTISGEKIDSFYSIIPIHNNGQSTILKITANFENIDNNTTMSKYIRKPVDLFSYYGIISYRYLGNYKTEKLTRINVSYENDKYSYLEVPKEVENANKVKLILLIRGSKYTFNLK